MKFVLYILLLAKSISTFKLTSRFASETEFNNNIVKFNPKNFFRKLPTLK